MKILQMLYFLKSSNILKLVGIFFKFHCVEINNNIKKYEKCEVTMVTICLITTKLLKSFEGKLLFFIKISKFTLDIKFLSLLHSKKNRKYLKILLKKSHNISKIISCL